MNEIKRILMNRDDFTSSEADRELSMMREDFYSIAESGGSIEDVEELLYSEGLETVWQKGYNEGWRDAGGM